MLITALNDEAYCKYYHRMSYYLQRLVALHPSLFGGVLCCISSIRVNDKYRIEFIVSQEENGKALLTICNIIELSNHYK